MLWRMQIRKKVMESKGNFTIILVAEIENPNVYLEGGTVPMELDKGSAVSVMGEGVYREYLRYVPLEDAPLKLRTYTGEMVKPMGFCYMKVQYNGHSKKLPICITKNEWPSLFGREWLESTQLNWPIPQLETSDAIPALDEVLSKHEGVFSEGLGKIKNIQARLHPKEGTQPRFWKSRPMALAREPAADEALRELETEGVIKKLATSEWDAPVVSPVKKNCVVRVCADFKVTINPQLKVDEHPLPCMDDIYTSLPAYQRPGPASCLPSNGG